MKQAVTIKKPKRPVRKQKRTIRPETRMLLKQFGIGFLAVSLVVSIVYAVYHGTRAEAVTLAYIEVSGGQTINLQEIEATAWTVLDGSYAKLVPRRFVYMYPHEEIVTALSSMPRVKKPRIERNNTTLVIRIDEYIPYALWCDEREVGDCLFVDEAGYAFAKAPFLEGSTFVRYRTLARQPSLKETLTDTEQLETVRAVVGALESEFRFPVVAVELDVVGDEFYILTGGSEIKVTRRMSPGTTISNLEAVLSASEFTGLLPGNFSYIDLRFGNKVFVNDTDPNKILEGTLIAEVGTSTDLDREPVLIPPLPEVPVITTPTLAAEPVVVEEISVAEIDGDSEEIYDVIVDEEEVVE